MKIFFDVDGVLIDGWHARPERRKPWDIAIAQDLGIDRKALQEAFFRPREGSSRSMMQVCLEGERDLKEALAEALPRIGYGGSVDELVAYWFAKDSNVNRELLEIVKRLASNREVELYIATGQEHHRAAYLRDVLGLGEHFRDIFYSAGLGVRKNSPAFFRRINELLGIAASERPLLFDDSEGVARLARQAGWDACIFETVDDVVQHPRMRELLNR